MTEKYVTPTPAAGPTRQAYRDQSESGIIS